jgi:hypothetical protein
MQKLFPTVANDLFDHQANQLRSILYRKLVVMAKLLEINDNILHPSNEPEVLHEQFPKTAPIITERSDFEE